MFGMKLEDEVAVPVAITEIRVTGGTGSVKVRPGPASGVTIHRTVHHFALFRPRPGPTHRVDGTVWHLDTNLGTSFPFFVAVDCVVDAPPAYGCRAGCRRAASNWRIYPLWTSNQFRLDRVDRGDGRCHREIVLGFDHWTATAFGRGPTPPPHRAASPRSD